MSVGQQPPITIIQAMTDPHLFGRWFSPAESWGAWAAFLKALFGLAMTEEEAAIFRRHTGRTTPPAVPAREMWVVVGRRGGKSLVAAVIAVYVASFRRGHVPKDPSGWAVVVVLAADREQAKVVLRYVAGLIDAARPDLRGVAPARAHLRVVAVGVVAGAASRLGKPHDAAASVERAAVSEPGRCQHLPWPENVRPNPHVRL